MHIKFLGGVRTVTGSSHLVSTDKSEVLIDAGLFHGRRDEAYKINTTLTYNPRTLDAVVLSHAHIDHCGNLPTVVKNGLRCKIYMTHATKDLCKLMIEDSAKIQEEDTRYLNKINKKLGLPLRDPLYTRRDTKKVFNKFHSLSYNQKFRLAKDISVTLFDAGHILGSAIVVLTIQNNAKEIRLGYAVDLGRNNLPLLCDPVVPKGLDYLIIETTYGARMHAPIEEAKVKLKEAINRTISRGGKIIIPSFTLERTQEVVYFLNSLLKDKAIPAVPIYVDSPLAVDITELFRHHLAYLDETSRQEMLEGRNPLEFLNIKYIREQIESKALNNDKRPMIIIAGSGMCESGRILHHLKNNIADSRNTVLVVGYMAENTLGRKIVDKARLVRIFGMEYELNAEVVIINAFSGHADRDGLLNFINSCLPLKRIFLVHGELSQTQLFCDTLIQNKLDAYIPSRDEEVLIE